MASNALTVHLVWMRPDVVSVHATEHQTADGRTRVKRCGSIVLGRSDCEEEMGMTRNVVGPHGVLGPLRIPVVPVDLKGHDRWLWLIAAGCEAMQRCGRRR